MADVFNEIAEKYDQTIALINSLDDWVYVKNLSLSRQKVLDIGCGSGHLLEVLSKYFDECYGIDNAEKMIELAEKNNPDFKLICGNAEKLPYEDEYFDYVVTHTTFHHLNKEKATGEAKRVLKKGGKLVIVDVVLKKNKFRKKLEKFYYRYFLSWLRMALRDGIKKTVEAWKYSEGPIWSGHVKSEKQCFLNKQQFKDFYSRLLPDAKFGTANYAIGYLVWRKPL